MVTIDAAGTRAALPFERLIEALEAMFVRGCTVPPRHFHTVGDVQSLLMPAWTNDGGYYGVKVVNVAPHNRAAGLPSLFATYQLFDARSGEPLAQIDGNEITSRRTAAASALAASRLAPPDARVLTVLGTGRVGSVLPEAYAAVRPIARVRVWDRNPAAAERLAGQLRASGIQADAAGDLEAAVREADIVSCATGATTPLVRGDWLSPHGHLDLIGSFTPAMREADDACFLDCAVWVDTPEALQKSGDLLQPMASGVLSAADVRGTLEDLCRAVPGVARPAGRTVFKSVGTALEDLAAAILVYESRR